MKKKYPLASTKIINNISTLLDKFVKTVKITGNGKEACALIFGFKEEPDFFIMTDYYPTRNVLESSAAFLIDPEELVTALIMFEDEMSKELVAIFHSHPGWSNIPSSTDIKFMHYWRIPWFICGAAPRQSTDIRAFILGDEDEIKEIVINANLETNSRD